MILLLMGEAVSMEEAGDIDQEQQFALNQQQLIEQLQAAFEQIEVAQEHKQFERRQSLLPQQISTELPARLAQRLKQAEGLDTTKFLIDHLNIISDPDLKDRSAALILRFGVFMHCIKWIVADNRLEEVEDHNIIRRPQWDNLSNKDIFIKIHRKLKFDFNNYWGTGVTEERQIKELLRNEDNPSFIGGIDDLHWLCMHSKIKFIIQVVRRFLLRGGHHPLFLFSPQQMLQLFDRLSVLRKEAWTDGKVNERVRDAYWQLAGFVDQTHAHHRYQYAMPLPVYNQIVDDLIEHQLDDDFLCYEWLNRQMKTPKRRNLLRLYMRQNPGKIDKIFDSVCRSTSSIIKEADRKSIEHFMKHSSNNEVLS